MDKQLLILRMKRDGKLQSTDWTQLPDAPISEQLKEAYKVYRQALRDLPEQENPVWPEEPS